jgi:hypothetical protein
VLTDCLDTITSRALNPPKSSICSRASSEFTEDLTAWKNSIRSAELFRARFLEAGTKSISDEALLDLKDRLHSVSCATSKSSHDGSIRQSTKILDSFMETAALSDDLERALEGLPDDLNRALKALSDDLDRASKRLSYSDVDDYYRNVGNDDPLPPPLKVYRTLWPERQAGTGELLYRRERANKDASQWQEGVLRKDKRHKIRSMVEYLSYHRLIRMSAKLRETEIARILRCYKVEP